MTDINVWLWARAITPATHKDEFQLTLWDIFLKAGRWEELVNKTIWAIPTTNKLRDVGGPWLWPTGTDPTQIDPVYLAKWLGAVGGVTPDRARD